MPGRKGNKSLNKETNKNMARKINMELTAAIRRGGALNKGNTVLKWVGDCWSVELHGNRIAHYEAGQHLLHLDCCGWHTPVTRDRLNAICEAVGLPDAYRIKHGALLYNGSAWPRNTFAVRWDNVEQEYRAI